jgi:hypothetical protein
MKVDAEKQVFVAEPRISLIKLRVLNSSFQPSHNKKKG